MWREIMIYIFLVLVTGLMWFPGFILSYNMIIAMGDRKPTVGEIVLSCIPGVNLGIARKQLYGSAKIVWASLVLLAVSFILKLVFFYFFDTPLGILLSLVFTFVFYGVVVICWFVQSYVLFDMGNVIQSGFVVKILAFIIPPLSSYFIGRDCIPKMRAALYEMEKENEDNYVYE